MSGATVPTRARFNARPSYVERWQECRNREQLMAVVTPDPDAVDADSVEAMRSLLHPPLVPVELGRLYTDALGVARATAREHGYALAVHGSQMRDLDLIAVPWVEECSTPEVLALAIRDAVHGAFSQEHEMLERPHGRQCWSIVLKHSTALGDALAAGPKPFHPYLDLSVMPPALGSTPGGDA